MKAAAKVAKAEAAAEKEKIEKAEKAEAKALAEEQKKADKVAEQDAKCKRKLDLLRAEEEIKEESRKKKKQAEDEEAKIAELKKQQLDENSRIEKQLATERTQLEKKSGLKLLEYLCDESRVSDKLVTEDDRSLRSAKFQQGVKEACDDHQKLMTEASSDYCELIKVTYGDEKYIVGHPNLKIRSAVPPWHKEWIRGILVASQENQERRDKIQQHIEKQQAERQAEHQAAVKKASELKFRLKDMPQDMK